MSIKFCMLTCLLMSCTLSHSTPSAQTLMNVLSHIGIGFNEDLHLPLHSSTQTLHAETARLACMEQSITELDPDSYAHTYITTLIIGQRAVISYIKQQLQEESDADKQRDRD